MASCHGPLPTLYSTLSTEPACPHACPVMLITSVWVRFSPWLWRVGSMDPVCPESLRKIASSTEARASTMPYPNSLFQ